MDDCVKSLKRVEPRVKCGMYLVFKSLDNYKIGCFTNMDEMREIRVLVLGDEGVGETSVLL